MKKIIVFALVFISLNANAQETKSTAKDSLSFEILKIINNRNWGYYLYYIKNGSVHPAFDKKYKPSSYILSSKVLIENDSLILNFGKNRKSFSLVENNFKYDKIYTITNEYQDEFKEVVFSMRHPWGTTKNSDLEQTQGIAETRKLYDLLIKYKNVHIAIARAKELEEFKIQFQKFLELSEKLTVSEEQRKFIVQANAQNEEKKYANALKLYEKAIEINSFSYPAAYYNMALIAAQLGNYNYAIFNMKKYLIIEPNAPDTRAAQDKIYEWELKINN